MRVSSDDLPKGSDSGSEGLGGRPGNMYTYFEVLCRRVDISIIESLVMHGDAWTVQLKIHVFTRFYEIPVLTRKGVQGPSTSGHEETL